MVYVLSDLDSYASVQATIPSKHAGRRSESTGAQHHFRRAGTWAILVPRWLKIAQCFQDWARCILTKIDQDGQGRISVVTDPVSSISLGPAIKINDNQFGRPPKAAWTWAIADFGVLRTAATAACVFSPVMESISALSVCVSARNSRSFMVAQPRLSGLTARGAGDQPLIVC